MKNNGKRTMSSAGSKAGPGTIDGKNSPGPGLQQAKKTVKYTINRTRGDLDLIKKPRKQIEKPCLKLGWCPYGPLVEDFPLKEKRDNVSCGVFGHDCPVFTMAEGFVDNPKEK